jgi:hypothetical protein
MLTVSELGSFRLCIQSNFEEEALAELRSLSGLARKATQEFSPNGMLLTGSLARGEGTLARDDGGRMRWLSDIECLLVFDDQSRTAWTAIQIALARACAEFNGQPARRTKGLKADLSSIGATQLARMRPSIFTYELGEHGKLLWGEPSTVPMPIISPQRSLRRDGFRLLNNRIMEIVNARAEWESHANPTPVVIYALDKFWRELGSSLSTFVGCYRTTYQQRGTALLSILPTLEDRLGNAARMLTARLGSANAPGCSQVRITENEIFAEFASAMAAAAEVWNWESGHLLTGDSRGRGWRDVSVRLRKIEKTSHRIRDWGRLVRRGAIVRYLGVPALAAIARAGSLGNAIYTAGCLLCFHWEEFGSDDEANRDIVRSVSGLFDLEPRIGPRYRQLLVQRTYQAWNEHLRRTSL